MTDPGQKTKNCRTGSGIVQKLASPILIALQYGLGSLISFSVALLFSRDIIHITSGTAMIGALWAMITFISVTQDCRSSTQDTARLQVLGAFLGAVLSGIFLITFPFSIPGMACLIGLVVLLCQVLGMPGPARLAALTVGIVMVISAINPNIPPVVNAMTRFLEVLIGSTVAIGIVCVWQYLPGNSGKTG